MSETSPPESQRGRPLKSWLLPLVVLLAIFYLQWPMVKGSYYRATSTSSDEASAAVGGLKWGTNFEQALAESEKSGKPVLLDFSASWCPPCQVMKHEVWPNSNVIEAANQYVVPVLVDIDLPENRAIAEKYRVQSIPTLIVVDSKGEVLRQAGYLTVTEALDFLSQNTRVPG